MRRNLPRLSLALLATFVVLQSMAEEKKDPAVVPPREGETKKIDLFNGKDLKGWQGYEDLWSVKDGEIVGHNAKPLKFSTYLLTPDKYSDFRLTFSTKLVQSEMHSGIAFWGEVKPTVSKEPEKDRTEYTYAGHLVMFPSGYGLYDLFGRNGLPVDGKPAQKVGKQHDWNLVEILAQGNRIRVAVNGTQVVDWRDPEPKRIKEGPHRPAVTFQRGAPGSPLQGPETGDVHEGR